MQNFAQYLKSAGKSDSTIRNYMLDMRLAVKHGIVDESLQNFNLQALKDLELSGATKRRMLAGIRKFARYKVNTGQIDRVPELIVTAELPKSSSKLPKVTFSADAKTLIGQTTDNEMKLALHILATTGCRIDSLVSLTVDDFSDDGIRFRKTKGDKPYTSFITDTIKNLLPKVATDGYVFCKKNGDAITPDAFRVRMNRHFGAAYRNPHSFRHGVATELINNDVDIYTVSLVLNHSNIQTTTNYIHTTGAHLKRKLEGKHPFLGDPVK